MADSMCCCVLVVSVVVSEVCCQSLPGHTTPSWLMTTTTNTTSTATDDKDGYVLLMLGWFCGPLVLFVLLIVLVRVCRKCLRWESETSTEWSFSETIKRIRDRRNVTVTDPAPTGPYTLEPPSYDDAIARDDPPPTYSEYERQSGGRP